MEYEVNKPDVKSNIFVNFDQESYQKFIDKSIEIFNKFKNECNKDNKNLIKISDECDYQFGNKYTHGGYECGADGKWGTTCVPSYCDPGYFFNQKLKKCEKDVCSSIPVVIDDSEQKPNNNTSKNGQKNNLNSSTIFLYFLSFCFLVL